jgi:hypothetical protein
MAIISRYTLISLIALSFISSPSQSFGHNTPETSGTSGVVKDYRAGTTTLAYLGVPGCYRQDPKDPKKLKPKPIGCPCNSPGANLQCNAAHNCRPINVPIPDGC